MDIYQCASYVNSHIEEITAHVGARFKRDRAQIKSELHSHPRVWGFATQYYIKIYNINNGCRL